ncbi:MAG: hypothetical protein E7342_01160 [Clostridiales bacterium]|nr:hypothetical protein [Clostridiales bacterium]
MDNKITKKRLGEMLSYDWLKIIALCALFVILFEILMSAFSVKLTVGQSFEIIVYPNVNSTGTDNFKNTVLDKKVLSYDVLSFNTTNLDTTYYGELLSSVDDGAEGDLLIVDNLKTYYDKAETLGASNMDGCIDKYSIYDFESLIKDAKSYLLKFTNGKTFDEVKNLSFKEFLSEEKLETVFKERMKKDNRFRTKKDFEEGLTSEKARIKTLFTEVILFENLFNEYKDSGLFIKYTKFTASYHYAKAHKAMDEEYFLEKMNEEKELYYGLELGFFENNSETNSSKNPITTYFKYVDGYFDNNTEKKDSNTAKDLAILVYNFKKEQPHLQFEVIPVINCLIRSVSTLLG